MDRRKYYLEDNTQIIIEWDEASFRIFENGRLIGQIPNTEWNARGAKEFELSNGSKLKVLGTYPPFYYTLEVDGEPVRNTVTHPKSIYKFLQYGMLICSAAIFVAAYDQLNNYWHNDELIFEKLFLTGSVITILTILTYKPLKILFYAMILVLVFAFFWTIKDFGYHSIVFLLSSIGLVIFTPRAFPKRIGSS